MFKEITLTYINIRQSISILLGKLFFVDFITISLILFFYYLLIRGSEFTGYRVEYVSIFSVLFLILGIFKLMLDIYVVLKWLNEYYEITPDYISHKKGVIFRKEEKYRLDNVREMRVSDSLLGEILNYGTISLYDIRLQKYLDMYLIHNPDRYVRILSQLKPNIEIKRETIIPIVRKGEWRFGGA